MIIVTKKRILKLFREHWVNIANRIKLIRDGKSEFIYPVSKLKRACLNILHKNIENACYLCEYDINKSFYLCELCLLEWPSGNGCGELYSMFVESYLHKNFNKAIQLALEISNLPERGKWTIKN